MTRIRVWLVAILAALTLTLVGVITVFVLDAGEYICLDRRPWWGPPEDPNTSCAGYIYLARHPEAPYPGSP
jgi:hypothetical protein